ncbi:VpsR-related response regulator [Oceanimonas marisflavi]|uniref:VpsR-related response regulator n=1 Tax=Oceanimonas marisflavi TaxID=2059724 RepID=UPI000D30F8B3|nr:VpsR-related response regulator [Oceanimonas marisflavi]
MILNREILLVQSSCAPACLSGLGDEQCHWSLIRYSNLEAAAGYLDNTDALIAIIDAGQAEVPAVEVEHFLNRYAGVAWIALLSKEQLEKIEWQRFIARYCYDFHTVPVVKERLLITLGRAYGMNKLKDMLTIPFQKGEVLGKSEFFKESLRKIYEFKNGILTLAGERGVGKHFLAKKWAELYDITIVDMCPSQKPLSGNLLFGNNDLPVSSERKVAFLIDCINSLPKTWQNEFCQAFLGGGIMSEVVFLNELTGEETSEPDRLIPEMKALLSKNRVVLPPLRERGQDKIILARYFLNSVSSKWDKSILGFTSDTELVLMNYGWPGNINELAERIMIGVSRCENHYLSAEMMGLDNDAVIANGNDLSLKKAREEAEALAIKRVLNMVPGKTERAAELLCISRSSLHRLIARYGIRRES